MEFNFLNNSDRVPPKDHFCEVCLQLAMWFRRGCCFKKLLTTDEDGHGVITIAHHEQVQIFLVYMYQYDVVFPCGNKKITFDFSGKILWSQILRLYILSMINLWYYPLHHKYRNDNKLTCVFVSRSESSMNFSINILSCGWHGFIQDSRHLKIKTCNKQNLSTIRAAMNIRVLVIVTVLDFCSRQRKPSMKNNKGQELHSYHMHVVYV